MIQPKEEHTTSTVVPVRNISVLDKQFQEAHSEISSKERTLSPKPTLNTEDQIIPIHKENSNGNIRTESVNLEHHSSATRSSEDHLDQEKQSVTSAVHDQSHSKEVDLSDQLDQFPTYENNTPSTEQLTADSKDNLSLLNKHINSQNEENKSSRSISNLPTVSMIVVHFDYEY